MQKADIARKTAFYAADPAWNGRFVAAVRTTKIFCLPSCTGPKPLEKNVQFFAMAAEARALGFRACKRCRPLDHTGKGMSANEIADLVREDPARFASMAAVADACGLHENQLKRLFRMHYQREAETVIDSVRVAVASRRLIAGSDIEAAATAAGFSHTAAMTAAFRARMALAPEAYAQIRDEPEFVLSLPGGYRAFAVLRMLGRDADSLCERVDGMTIVKPLLIEGEPVVLTIRIEARAARCRVDRMLGPAGKAEVHSAALRLLGLVTDPAPFERRLRKQFSDFIAPGKGTRIPQTATVYESLLWAIVGQQINLPFAFELRRAVIRMCERKTVDGLRVHPTAADIARLDVADLQRVKFSRTKARYLIDASRLVASGELPVESFPDRSATSVRTALLGVNGIGPWTANYVMLRGCAFPDCVPIGDSALATSLGEYFALESRPDGNETEKLMQPFAPWRSFATFHFWMRMWPRDAEGSG